jgi:RimJ/RimL family protein N-acetyltransferase
LTGVVGYHAIDWENRSTALGYWLGEEYQGKGLVTPRAGRWWSTPLGSSA